MGDTQLFDGARNLHCCNTLIILTFDVNTMDRLRMR